MAKLRWDQVGERLYEAGVDRGVLYLTDGSGVSWNGLISVEEDTDGDASEPAYFDGIKYFDRPSIGDYSATLNAFTYPDEFLTLEGIESLGNGLFVDGQYSKLFGLSYRTRIGNDIDGLDHGYKIHLVYNLTTVPDATTHETLNESPNPLNFSWKITGIPQTATGYRPTAHIIFDSRFLNAVLFAALEDLIYGDFDTAPRQPSISELIDFISLFGPRHIVPDTVTGLAGLPAGPGDLTETNVSGVFSTLPSTRLVKITPDGLNQYV
jgi:hypothetical protein